MIPMRRWRAVCAYDGGKFSGWQSQPDGNAVQDVLERRLAAIFRDPVRVHGSGRTDAGVHARAQVFHFDAAWRHGPEKLLAALRDRLPEALQIAAVRPASPRFHARFSAAGKVYSYTIFLGDADPFLRPYCWSVFKPLDRDAMAGAAAVLRGRHDFRSFSAANGPRPDDTVRDLRRLELKGRGRCLRIVAEADGFLYKMVRTLVGALVAVGEARLTIAAVEQLLDGAPRTPAVQTAPPQGLFLERVYYRAPR